MNDGHRGKSERSRRWWRASPRAPRGARPSATETTTSATETTTHRWAPRATLLIARGALLAVGLLVATIVATTGTAAAQVTADGAPDRTTAPRLVDVITAQKPFAHAALGVSHRGAVLATLELTFGEIAALGVGYDDRLLVGGTAEEAAVQGRRSAWFRVNVEAGRWARWQPALDLTFQRTDGGDEGDGAGQAQAAELRATATKSWRSSVIGALDVTGGLAMWEVAEERPEQSVRLSDHPLKERVRPFAGLAWTPTTYPRTSLLLEGSFGPTVLAGQPRLDWRIGWGARYQAFRWNTIDLVVRNREGAGLAGSTVMVRLTALLD